MTWKTALFMASCYLALLSLACGSASTGPNSGSTANENQTSNSVFVPYPAAPVNSSNGNSLTAVNSNPVANVNSAQKLKMMSYPAPDDSEYSSTMNKSGMPIETRLFHNHPQLIKVVRTWKNINDKTISIYLKGGKVVKLPGDQIPNMNSVPASVFLDAAGTKPPASHPSTANTTQTDPQKIKPNKPE
jgi:hypothetical protein